MADETQRWEYEADIESLQTTGRWVDGVVPAWAANKAKELHCRSTSSAVIQFGLEEIIRLLKKELQVAEDRMYRRIED
jgi:hypothetical protein